MLFVSRHFPLSSFVFSANDIAYRIISVMDGSLPKKPCKTCKNRFHAACLYKVRLCYILQVNLVSDEFVFSGSIQVTRPVVPCVVPILYRSPSFGLTLCWHQSL